MQDWKNVTEIVHNIVVMLAAIAGGLWALNRWRRERSAEAAIEMTLTAESFPVGRDHLVVFTAQLANKGKTMVKAKTQKGTGEFVYSDKDEQLRYSCSLQIRSIRQAAASNRRTLDWFRDEQAFEQVLPEINMLTEYENPDRDQRAEFWMEPDESYRLRVSAVLPEGVYIAKLTFIGEDQRWLHKIGLSVCNDENFWSEISAFAVPTASTQHRLEVRH